MNTQAELAARRHSALSKAGHLSKYMLIAWSASHSLQARDYRGTERLSHSATVAQPGHGTARALAPEA